MLIPNFISRKFVDLDGNMTDHWTNNMSQLLEELGFTFSDEGYQLPFQNQPGINGLTGNQSVGRILYNTTTEKVQANLGGVWTDLGATTESDFIPTLKDSSGNQPAYVIQQANAIKLNDRVFCNIQLEISSKVGVTGTDPIIIGDLPYTVGSFNQVGTVLPGNLSFTFPPNSVAITPSAVNTQNDITMSWVKNTGAVDPVVWNDISSTGSMTLSINYKEVV